MKSLFLTFLLLSMALARAQKAPEFIFIPSTGEGPFPVAIWLHGYRGYSPEGYFPAQPREAMQKHADTIGVAIIGFPATTDLGDKTQQWSEEPVADHAYIQARLRKIAESHKLDLTRVALFGFSQGAMVAADLASCFPESYRGAILMSPGGLGSPQASRTPSPLHSKQIYYCLCGAGEHPGNVQLTKAYAQHLERSLGSKVTLKLYEGVSQHARPPDFMEKFPEWISEILKQDQAER